MPFKKRLTDGTMKNIAFALDPDGYVPSVVDLPESSRVLKLWLAI